MPNDRKWRASSRYWAAVLGPGVVLTSIGVMAHFVFSPMRGHHAVGLMWFFIVAGWLPSMLFTFTWVSTEHWRATEDGSRPYAKKWIVLSVLCSGVAAFGLVLLGRMLMMVLKPGMYS